MNIRFLKVFLAVVDYQTMNAAAKALHIAQPSVSQTIAEMENYYGVRLFDRLSKRLYLTRTGEELLAFARHIVSAFDDMEVYLKTSSETPLVRIGATAMFSAYYLSGIVKTVQEQHPSANLSIHVTTTAIVEENLLSSELDIGIVEGEILHPDIVCNRLATDHVLFVCGRDHPFYGSTAVHFRDFEGQTFISRENTSYLCQRLKLMAHEHGITYKETWKCTGSEGIKAAVISGLGIANISACMVQEELANGSLYAIPVVDQDFTREIILVYHKNKFFHPLLEAFAKTCRTYMEHEIQLEAERGRNVLS